MKPYKRLRIAILNRHFGKRFGGAEHYSVAIAEQLAKHHEIHVFAQKIEHQMPGFHYHQISRPLPKPRWLNQLWYAAATWWHTRRGFDVVHSHENTWHGNVQTIHVRPFRAGLFHGRTGLKKWIKWLSLCTSPRLQTYWWLERQRMKPRDGHLFIASSKTVMQEILHTYPLVAPKLHTIPPGVSMPNLVQNRQAQQIRMRSLLGLPQAVPMALFVGNDYTKKGLGTLLEALQQVSNLHLAVVGNPQQISIFEHKARELAVSKRVHFLGSLPDVVPAYEAADLLIHPTTEDTYAMVVIEAMAHGLPVIVSSAPFCGIADDLVHEQQALILNDPRNAQVLSNEINRLLSSPTLQEHLRTTGRHFASDRSWSTSSNEYELLFINRN